MTNNNGRWATIHYTSTLEDGTVLESTKSKNEPIEFAVGGDQILDDLDNLVAKMEVGETASVAIANAYGEHKPELVERIEASTMPGAYLMPVGESVLVDTENVMVRAKVIENQGNYVMIDANHPLAGKTVTFEVELVSLR